MDCKKACPNVHPLSVDKTEEKIECWVATRHLKMLLKVFYSCLKIHTLILHAIQCSRTSRSVVQIQNAKLGKNVQKVPETMAALKAAENGVTNANTIFSIPTTMLLH